MRRTKRSARATTVAVHSIFAAGAQFTDAPVADRGHLDPRGRGLDKHIDLAAEGRIRKYLAPPGA
jgi:hypothetical protein